MKHGVVAVTTKNMSHSSDRSRIQLWHSSEITNNGTQWHIPTVTFLFTGYACPICILPCSFSISLSFTAFQAGSMEPPCQCHQTDRCQCFCSLMGSALTSCHQQSYSTVRPTHPAPPSLHAFVLQMGFFSQFSADDVKRLCWWRCLEGCCLPA